MTESTPPLAPPRVSLGPTPGSRLSDPSSFGYSLLETLVALALVGLALVLALPLLALEVHHDQRLEARREMRALVELAVESVRVSGDPNIVRLVAVPRPESKISDLAVAARLLPEPGFAGLQRLELIASWKVGGRDDRIEVTTLVWRDS